MQNYLRDQIMREMDKKKVGEEKRDSDESRDRLRHLSKEECAQSR